MEKNSLTVVLGNQLFDYKHYKDLSLDFFMCEDHELCTHFKYHKHKIIHFLSSMRIFSEELEKKGKHVFYKKYAEKPHFLKELEGLIQKNKYKIVNIYEIEDKFFEQKLIELFSDLGIKVNYLKSPMFLTSRDEFKQYLKKNKKPFMNSFYILQRKKLGLLMEDDKPIGGQWSYDQENRKKIPKDFKPENFLPPAIHHPVVEEVKKLVDKHFPDHPGESSNYWIPVTRKDSLKWFRDYVKTRFTHFGDFQDALDERSPFLYHSLISPLINIGFITPDEVVEIAIEKVTEKNLANVEGFVRQIIGWREFLRGIYQNFDEMEQKSNFFEHKNKLTKHWYDGTTGVAPLDYAIKKAQTWGYCHHIERLMVIGNIMLLLEVHPQEVYRWFMEMFVDSSDWVMGPNVFGMSQFSDGGLFATKPYICSSNYLLKMSHYKKDPEWTDGLDGLYWMFIDKNRKFFEKNPRLGMMVKLFDKMPKEKRVELFKKAEKLKSKIVKTPKNN